MCSHHVCIEKKSRSFMIFLVGNPEQHPKPRLPLYTVWERPLPTKGFAEARPPRATKKRTLLMWPVAYTEVALSNVNISLLYIKGLREGKTGVENNAMM